MKKRIVSLQAHIDGLEIENKALRARVDLLELSSGFEKLAVGEIGQGSRVASGTETGQGYSSTPGVLIPDHWCDTPMCGFRGVSYDKTSVMWKAKIGKSVLEPSKELGRFVKAADAARAWDEAARERGGKYMKKLNFPDP